MDPSCGVAGRTDYTEGGMATTDLVTEVEKQEEDEADAEHHKNAVLGGNDARSQAEAEERAKLHSVQWAKKVLDTYMKREGQVMQEFPRLLGPINGNDDDETDAATAARRPMEHTATGATVVSVTREQLDAGKRVITLCDTSGASQNDTILLTQDLNNVESKMGTGNSLYPFEAKGYIDDADDNKQGLTQQSAAFGIIKLFIHNHEATVATIQADLCQDIHVEFRDATSDKKHIPGSSAKLFWGDDKDDRIFHAGVQQMKVSIYRDGYLKSERIADYVADGAVAVGNATPEEFQFVTSVIDGELVTEKVVRAGTTTGKNARAMTQRELKGERERREKAAAMARKSIPKPVTVASEEDDAFQETYYKSMTKDEIKAVEEYEQTTQRGNEAFSAGEYAQAILLYSLALDKADELSDKVGSSKSLFPRYILLSNRSACFLKLGQHEKALADASQAEILEPTYVKALFRRGLALHALERYAEAFPVLRECWRLRARDHTSPLWGELWEE